jgi:hypothetical protein
VGDPPTLYEGKYSHFEGDVHAPSGKFRCKNYTGGASLVETEQCLRRANREDETSAVAPVALGQNRRYRSIKMQAVFLGTEEGIQ